MSHVKSFVYDYRNSKDIRNILFKRVKGAMNELKTKDFLKLGLYSHSVKEDYSWRVTIS